MSNEIVHATKLAALKIRLPLAAFAGMIAVYAPTSLAYVGPGAGLGMLASLFAILLAVVATIVGLVLWPIRKFSRRNKPSAAEVERSAVKAPDDDGRRPN